MILHARSMQFARIVEASADVDELGEALRDITQELGFEHFALMHHVDAARGGAAIRLHDYPTQWADYYQAQALGLSDPVHRASHVTSIGFRWSQIPRMIPLTARDLRILALGREQGIGDGFTVPAHVPGEARGSCSFAIGSGCPMPETMLPLAQLAGIFAFEAARRLCTERGYRDEGAAPRLTDRQRDCVLWVARGKGDWEIGRILGVSEETVARHVKQACARYGVNKRTLLAIRTLFDGTLSFTELFRN
jgi:LuxR family quorum-sensing system transcriptional regulator CciR